MWWRMEGVWRNADRPPAGKGNEGQCRQHFALPKRRWTQVFGRRKKKKGPREGGWGSATHTQKTSTLHYAGGITQWKIEKLWNASLSTRLVLTPLSFHHFRYSGEARSAETLERKKGERNHLWYFGIGIFHKHPLVPGTNGAIAFFFREKPAERKEETEGMHSNRNVGHRAESRGIN